MEGPRSPTAPVSDPATYREIHLAGTLFLIFACLVFYLLVATWPVLIPDPSITSDKVGKAFMFKPFRLFGLGPCSWAPDLRMLLTVVLAGTIGSLVHTLTSFGDYVGNRRLSTSWMWWFILRTPIGIVSACLLPHPPRRVDCAHAASH